MRYLTSAVAAATTVALLVACSDEPTAATKSALTPGAAQRQEALSPSVSRDLVLLRRSLARFQDIRVAKAAGYHTKITSCMSDPSGGMGFHYGDFGTFDGDIDVDHPELLLYEPLPNGRLQFVAVEYAIPYVWHSQFAEAPELFGQKFKQNARFNLWGLHVWLWKENPSGTFASWNPNVTCANTDDLDVVPMVH